MLLFIYKLITSLSCLLAERSIKVGCRIILLKKFKSVYHQLVFLECEIENELRKENNEKSS